MGELLLLGIAITVEPIPVVGFILVLGSDNARRNGFAFIAAWVASLAAIVAGTLLVTGGKPPSHNSAPALWSAIANVAVGLILLAIAWRVSKRPADRPHKQPAWMAKVDRMSALGAASLGFLLQPWGLVAAGVTVILEADLHTTASIVVLVLFCLLATSSMATMQTYYLVDPEAARARLTGLQDWVDRNRDRGIVILSASFGVVLAAKGVYLIASHKA
jgi:drug/metabolite transporter (DMT)-like permease